MATESKYAWVVLHQGSGFMYGEAGEPTTEVTRAKKYDSIEALLLDIRESPQWDKMSFKPDSLVLYDFAPTMIDLIRDTDGI